MTISNTIQTSTPAKWSNGQPGTRPDTLRLSGLANGYIPNRFGQKTIAPESTRRPTNDKFTTAPTTPTTPTGSDFLSSPMLGMQGLSGMDGGCVDQSQQTTEALRRQMLASSAGCEISPFHSQAVDDLLVAAKSRIDKDMQDAGASLLRDGRSIASARDVYSSREIADSRYLTETAVERFCAAKSSRAQYLNPLKEHAAHRGATEVRKACLALSLPSAAGSQHAARVEKLEEKIDAYLKADKPEMNATAGVFSGRAFKALDEMKKALADLTGALGTETIRNDIMRAAAPALLDVLERKGHPVTHASLAAALNQEAFGAFRKMTESADMLLSMADTLRELMDPARDPQNPKAPPADVPQTPVTTSAPPPPQPHPSQPVFNFSGPTYYNNPSYGNVMHSPTVPTIVTGGRDDGARVEVGNRDHDSAPGTLKVHDGRAAASGKEEVDDGVEEGARTTDVNDTPLAQEAPQQATNPGSGSYLSDAPPPPTPGVLSASTQREQAHHADASSEKESTSGNPSPASFTPVDQSITSNPATTNPVGASNATFTPHPNMSYLDLDNPGLRRPMKAPGDSLYTQNVDAFRSNVKVGNRLRALGATKGDMVRVGAEGHRDLRLGNHRGPSGDAPVNGSGSVGEAGQFAPLSNGAGRADQAEPAQTNNATDFLRPKSAIASHPRLYSGNSNAGLGSARSASGVDRSEINHRGRGAEPTGTVHINKLSNGAGSGVPSQGSQ